MVELTKRLVVIAGLLCLFFGVALGKMIITDTDISIEDLGVQAFFGYIGNSSETKPTNVPIGTLFYETDTGMMYAYTGSDWKPTGHPVIVGTSTDVKPTTNVMVGTLFIETDTGKLYEFDGTTWKLTSITKLSELQIDTDLDMGGKNIINTNDILPLSDNVSTIGSPTLRYNAIYVYALYTGDLKFANGWVLTEAENLGLGSGIVFVSPNGDVYGVGDLQYVGNIKANTPITYTIMGLLIGLSFGMGIVVASRRSKRE